MASNDEWKCGFCQEGGAQVKIRENEITVPRFGVSKQHICNHSFDCVHNQECIYSSELLRPADEALVPLIK